MLQKLCGLSLHRSDVLRNCTRYQKQEVDLGTDSPPSRLTGSYLRSFVRGSPWMRFYLGRICRQQCHQMRSDTQLTHRIPVPFLPGFPHPLLPPLPHVLHPPRPPLLEVPCCPFPGSGWLLSLGQSLRILLMIKKIRREKLRVIEGSQGFIQKHSGTVRSCRDWARARSRHLVRPLVLRQQGRGGLGSHVTLHMTPSQRGRFFRRPEWLLFCAGPVLRHPSFKRKPFEFSEMLQRT